MLHLKNHNEMYEAGGTDWQLRNFATKSEFEDLYGKGNFATIFVISCLFWALSGLHTAVIESKNMDSTNKSASGVLQNVF